MGIELALALALWQAGDVVDTYQPCPRCTLGAATCEDCRGDWKHAEIVCKKIDRLHGCDGSGEHACPQCSGTKRHRCQRCLGTGTIIIGHQPGFRPRYETRAACPECLGKRLLICNLCMGRGRTECRECDGSGKRVGVCRECEKGKTTCANCEGTGWVVRPRRAAPAAREPDAEPGERRSAPRAGESGFQRAVREAIEKRP